MRTRIVVMLLAPFALGRAGELHDLARECNPDRMRQLLSRQPSLSEPDDTGMTPLHIAIDARQVDCVGLLLEAGADRLARDRNGRDAFHAADQVADRQDQHAIRRHLVGGSVQKASQEPSGPMPWSLEYAVTHRQTDLTKMLLGMGADPNTVGTRGSTPLADAALTGNVDGVRLLLDAGARLDGVSQNGAQPIHDASLGNNPDVIRELARRGADINARTRDQGLTPLHFAASMGKLQAAEALVALGADQTLKDSNGRTPFDAAERAGLSDVATFLKRAASSAGGAQ